MTGLPGPRRGRSARPGGPARGGQSRHPRDTRAEGASPADPRHGLLPKRSFQNEVDVSVVDDKRLSDLPFDLSSRGQWKLDKSF
ncbi:hypothetical protein [Pseudonocardia sp. ICBG1293]|uniref:hypothetical protein n=1 Tax=Pseudonocardia sp. ICBG1293 TaxID=2844382 RepID=UPI001CC8FA8D|nr:hypothetical protein [Pseudonocardia sp. ICBG1293]